MAKNTERNRKDYNREARKEYTKKNFKYQTVCFKNEEMDEINAYCEKYGIPKNTLLREAAMNRIGKSIE